MSLKTVLLKLKEALENNDGLTVDEFIAQLEGASKRSSDELDFYFNFLKRLTSQHPEGAGTHSEGSKKVNRKWTKSEVEFMFQYINERQEEGMLNITEILEEVAQLLGRGYQSVNYKYYTIVKAKEKKKAERQNAYTYTTIPYNEVPVLSTAVMEEAGKVNVMPQMQSDDLLDILSGLITNVQQLPGINLHDLLRSLYQLTNMALDNKDSALRIESIKSEVSQEKESLREKLIAKEKQLLQERKRHEKMQNDVAELTKEIIEFNQLGDAAKIQNLKSFNQKLNNIVEGSNITLQVSG